MTGRWGKKGAAGIVCASLVGVVAPGAIAQVGSGTNVTADISSSFTIDDNDRLVRNPRGSTTTLDTNLSLGVVTETPLARFSLETGGRLLYENSPRDDDENGFDNPFLRLGYNLQRPGGNLSAAYRISTRDISDSFLTDLDNDFLEDDLIIDVGELENTLARVSGRFGDNAAIGGRFAVSTTERDYSGTVNPLLFDSTRDNVRGSLRFRFSPVATGRVIASWSEYNASDIEETFRETTGFGVGLAYELSPSLRFDGELIDNEIETIETLGASRVTRNRTGISGFGRLVRDMPNGDISLEASSRVASLVTLTTIRADRRMEIPGAFLNFGVGVTDSDAGTSTIIGSLEYERELTLGVLTAAFQRNASVTSDDEEILTTQVNLGFLRELTPSSELDVTFELADVEDNGLGFPTESRLSELLVTYRRDLVNDWDWSVAYRARQERSGGGSTDRSNAILTTIEKSFSLRP